MKNAVLIALTLAASARADALKDLRAALSGSSSTGTLSAKLTVTRWQRASGDKTPTEASGGATFHIADGPSGVTVSCSPAILSHKPPSVPAQNEQSLVPLLALAAHLTRVHSLLNHGPELLEVLEKAEVLEEKEVTWHDQPARALKLKLAFELPDSGFKADVTSTLSLLIDADGLPLASDRVTEIKAGLLMIRIKNQIRVQREYARREGRVVIVKETEETSGSGMGRQLQTKQDTALELK